MFLMTKVKVLKKVGSKFMLKGLRFSHERMSSGSLFQSSGAETEYFRSIGLKVKANRIETERRG